MEFGSSLDVAAVLSAVAQRILEVSGADMCDVCSLDGEEAEVLVSLRSDGQEVPVGQRYPLPDFATFREARASRRPVVVLDVLLDESLGDEERNEAMRWGYRASMDVPLFSQGEVSGFLSLYNERSRPFMREDLIVGLAQVAGQALVNAAMYESQMAANRETRLLNEIAKRTAASLDLDEIVRAAVDELHHLLGFERYGLVLREIDGAARVIAPEHDADALLELASSGTGQRAAPAAGRDAHPAAASAGGGAPGDRLPDARGHVVGGAHRHALGRRRAGFAHPAQRRTRRLRGRRSGPAGACRHPALPGHPQRPALRRDQADAPGQPQGPQLRAERQGLLHPGPRLARIRLHGHAGPPAGLDGRPARAARGGRVPARHRQDQHLGPGAAQARPPEPAGVAADAPAPGVQRRHHPAAVPGRAGAGRAPPPRALQRRRLPRRPGRRGDPAAGARHGRGGLLRRHVLPPAVQRRQVLHRMP